MERFLQKTVGKKDSSYIFGKLLFIGPPGTGKTALTRAFAKSLAWPYFELDLSSIISSYLGETAKIISSVFKSIAEYSRNNIADSNQGALLFLDEFDSIGSNRANSRDHQEIARAVNTLLIELERHSFFSSGLFIICATNLETQLDPALLRRFDSVINFQMPGIKERIEILDKLLNRVEYQNINSRRIAELTNDFSPSDLKRLIFRIKFYHIINSKLIVDDSLIKSIIEKKEVDASNKIVNGKQDTIFLPGQNKNTNQNSIYDITIDFESSFNDMLKHTLKRDINRRDELLSALEKLEKIPIEIRRELYYYTYGRILGLDRPFKRANEFLGDNI